MLSFDLEMTCLLYFLSLAISNWIQGFAVILVLRKNVKKMSSEVFLVAEITI